MTESIWATEETWTTRISRNRKPFKMPMFYLPNFRLLERTETKPTLSEATCWAADVTSPSIVSFSHALRRRILHFYNQSNVFSGCLTIVVFGLWIGFDDVESVFWMNFFREFDGSFNPTKIFVRTLYWYLFLNFLFLNYNFFKLFFFLEF